MTNYQFRKNLIEGMINLGYEKVITESSEYHFVKNLNNGFYVTILIQYHRFEKGTYTAEFHLDYYASSGYTGLDSRLSPRVAKFLKIEERKALLNNDLECVDQEGIDAWWRKSDEDSVFNFLKTIALTEERFLKSNNVFNRVLENNKILLVYFDLLSIEKLVVDKAKMDEDFICQPKKEKYGIDPIWYQACEIYQREQKKKNKYVEVSRSTVLYQTVAAYRNYIFEQRYGKPPFFGELLARYNKLLEDEKNK